MTMVYLLTGKNYGSSNEPSRYTEALNRQVGFVAPTDLDGGRQEILQQLIRSMRAFDEMDRLSMEEVVNTCTRLLDASDVGASLERFGRDWVLPLADDSSPGHPGRTSRLW